MASVSIYARSSKASQSSTGATEVPLYLRITHKGERVRVSLGEKVRASQWNENRKEVRSSHPNHRRLNRKLRSVRQEVEQAILDLEDAGTEPTPKRVKREWKGEEGESTEADTSVVSELRRALEERDLAEGTKRSYATLVNKFEEFAGDPSELSEDLIREWIEWMEEEKKNRPNTVARSLRVIKSLSTHAGLDSELWDGIEIPSETVVKSVPPVGVIPDLMELWRSTEREKMKEALSYFLTSFFAGGMRFGSVVFLRWSELAGWPGEDARVQYKMRKTGDLTGLPIVSGLREIFEQYDHRRKEGAELIFPRPSTHDLSTEEDRYRAKQALNTWANRHLKKAADEVEVSKLTPHMARNLAGAHYYRKTEDVYAVMRMMNHSSIDQTEQYLRACGFTVDPSFADAFEDIA